jgi:hypothetical protein
VFWFEVDGKLHFPIGSFPQQLGRWIMFSPSATKHGGIYAYVEPRMIEVHCQQIIPTRSLVT